MARRRPSLKLGARLQVLSAATQSPVPPLLIGQRVLHLGLHTLLQARPHLCPVPSGCVLQGPSLMQALTRASSQQRRRCRQQLPLTPTPTPRQQNQPTPTPSSRGRRRTMMMIL